MKKIRTAFYLASLFAVCFVACSKDKSSGSATKTTVVLSKSIVKLGEPLFATANNAGNKAVIKWSVNPASNAYISAAAGGSVILFSSPGAYSVTANYYTDSGMTVPYDSSSSPVTVSDSIYNDTTAYCNSILSLPINSNDQVTIIPLSNPDTGLAFLVHTTDLYAHFPSLTYTFQVSNTGEYDIAFNTVTESVCITTDPSPATTFLSMGILTNGTHALKITLNGVNYEGSVLVSDASCIFSWSYTSGVVINPLQVNN